jgi:mRNA interferase RelE/StbE
MAWKIEFSPAAEKELDRLDPAAARRILRFLLDRLASHDNPRDLGEALRGERFGEFWKYRVGDYRIVARIEDGSLRVLVVRIGHRREVYR